MSTMTESERVAALEQQVRDLVERLITSQAQTERAIINTDRAIAQTSEALVQVQRFRKLYEDEVAKGRDAAHDETLSTKEK